MISTDEKSTKENSEVLSRLERAINSHDLKIMESCFASDYHSTFPAHPDREFTGTAQMKSNWSKIFFGVPNLRAKLLRQVSSKEATWAEWEWEGDKADGSRFNMCGVTIQGIQENQIVWARMYMEPVVEGKGIDTSIQQQMNPSNLPR